MTLSKSEERDRNFVLKWRASFYYKKDKYGGGGLIKHDFFMTEKEAGDCAERMHDYSNVDASSTEIKKVQ